MAKFRNRVLTALAAALLVTVAPSPAHATSKEMIELQTQVQQLLDMVQRMQSTLDTRFGVLQHLAEQTADEANRMTATVSQMQQRLNTQSDNMTGKLDATSGQMQSLNDSVDELKSRIAKLEKGIQEMEGQLQAVQTLVTPAQPATASPGVAGQPQGPAVQQMPPLKETFESAVRDYNAAKYEVASGEFQDVVHFYPLDDLSGDAQFYLGEIAYRQQNYSDAVKAYNAVIEAFPGSKKAPAALLHKGLSELQLGKRDAGIHELRSLLQRHPQTPEAAQARTKLNGMGVKIMGR